jgi:putative heme-binding domain-containing protein
MPRWNYLGALIILHFSFCIPLPVSSAAPPLELKKGDHICIIGNTLAERMQHDGWLETMLHARFPEHELVIRNLGFSGDEITTRLRSAGFGSPDEWLTRCQADVIFAFFGYNESWAGEAGLPKFKEDLDKWIKHTLSQKYNGKSPPRLVLFGPIFHDPIEESNRERHRPDTKTINTRIELYGNAMGDIAAANQVQYCDLSRFTHAEIRFPNQKYKNFPTINGVHLSASQYYYLAIVICQLLAGESNALFSDATVQINQAVLDKNFYWFHRYRTTDGYSIYGGRADLKFTNGQSNREVMQREMEILDVMTANRDKNIWAVAQGKGYKVDDSNTPPFIEVITNKPGNGPNGAHTFLGGEEAVSKMRLGKNLKINLFASEERFPELANPVQMTWDAKGRLWVAVWPTYPHWKPKEPMNDKILIFEDTDGDGKADKMTSFADHLHCPTGFEFWNGGVIVAQAPDLMFLKDTNGDDKADVRERILHGLDSADTHHTANSFTFDPGGALYFQEGTFHHTQVETPWGPPVRCVNGGVFRYEPRTHKFEVYVAHNFANPHGHVFDRWGQDIVVDGTGSQPYHAALFSGHVDYPDRHRTPPQVYKQRTRPCPGIEYCSSQHFPADWQGNLLVPNVIGDQGILRYKIEDDGASFKGSELEPIVLSSDPNFRPSDLKIGPDGAIYFIDWHNPIIGHMQHNLRDPSRDRTHGRIYRITYEGRPLSKSPPIAGQSIEQLLECLKHPEDRVRYRARQELWARKSEVVISAVEQWLQTLNNSDTDFEHHRLEALWLYQAHNVVNERLLREVLQSPSYRARSAAVRVLCYWRDRISNSASILQQMVRDEHPRVRLEAIRAASFFPADVMMPIAVAGMVGTSDRFIGHVFLDMMERVQDSRLRAMAYDRINELVTQPAIPSELRHSAMNALARVRGRESQTFATLVQFVSDPKHRTVALKAIQKLPRSTWSKQAAPSLFEQMLAIVRAVPPNKRADPANLAVYEFADALTTLLPADQAAKYRKELQALGVRVIRIGTLPERMSYDKEFVAVQAGKPVEIVFDNIDAMPHNLVIGQPGSLEELGMQAEATATDADAPKRNYVPKSNKLLFASKLIQPNEMQRLTFNAPKEPGVYPIVCTYPGHWRVMHMALYVVPDLEKYSASPESYLAANPLPVHDPLLKDRRPRTEWKFEELVDAVATLKQGRDYANGKMLFQTASCSSCHRLENVGNNYGPDLTQLDKTWGGKEVLKELLAPSERINEKFQSYVFTTATGKIITGLILEEKDDHVKIIENPLSKAEPIILKKIDIESKDKSATSLMPKGLLDKLSKDEILDLIAYVLSKGNAESELFHKAGHQHGKR